jgi:hypothetical protein
LQQRLTRLDPILRFKNSKITDQGAPQFLDIHHLVENGKAQEVKQ